MSKPYDLRLNAIWHFCSQHRMLVEHVDLCGCFHCKKFFQATDIENWVDEGETALCPRCGIDSVLPDVPLYTLDKTLLAEMHRYFFS